MSGHAARQRPVFRMTTNRVQPEAADDAAAPATPRISDTDVLVIGGGPAGSTIPTLLARKGWQVTQLEKEARRSAGWGTSVSVRVDLVGSRLIKKTHNNSVNI